MSLDERLRDAYRADDGWAPGASLVTIRAEARRRGRRRGLIAAAAAVVLAAGLGVAVSRAGDDPTPAPPAPAVTEGAASAVEGQWSSAPLTRARVRVTLAEAGLGSWTDEFLAEIPASRDARLELRVEAGSLDLALMRPGRPEVLLDREYWQAERDRLVLTPMSGVGASHHTWEVDGDRLVLTFVSTSEPVTRGIPGEVYQRVLYTAVPFTRD